jgi:hypothetical protein
MAATQLAKLQGLAVYFDTDTPTISKADHDREGTINALREMVSLVGGSVARADDTLARQRCFKIEPASIHPQARHRRGARDHEQANVRRHAKDRRSGLVR